MKHTWTIRKGCPYAVAAFTLLCSLCLTPVARGQLTATLRVTVTDGSDWTNSETNGLGHFYVRGVTGSPTDGEGRIMLALYSSASGSGGPVNTTYLEPTNGLDLVSLPTTTASWMTEFEGILRGQSYTLVAWIDGNGNRVYDEGEPVGSTGPRYVDSSFVWEFVHITEDSDNDGMEDWWEAHWFTDLSQMGHTDYDNDGLSNLDERNLIEYGNADFPNLSSLRPNDWDSDGDRMDDGWELYHSLDPTSAAGDNGATGDPDGDTLNNLFEYRGPDGRGPKEEGVLGRAIDTGSTDTMNPRSQDTDDDGVKDNVEVLYDLTHPSHSMSSTNYAPRSLSMSVNGGAGVPLTGGPAGGGHFAFGEDDGTVEFWIYPEANTTDGTIYHFPTAGAGDDHFRITIENRRPKMEILTGATVFAHVGGDEDSVEQLPTNRWSHVAFVWTPDNNSLDIFVDGVLLIAQKTFFKPAFVVGPPSILQGFSDGYIDELRVWNYARSASDIEYWSHRIYPAPGYIPFTTRTCGGWTVYNYEYGNPLLAYYRFDDGGATVENYAFLNDQTYALPAVVSAAVTSDKAANVFGSDDADGDGVPEWWVSLHNLEQYREYYSSAYGPIHEPCPDDPTLIVDFKYFRSFIAYGSVGNNMSWSEDDADPEGFFYTPKTQLDFDEGVYSTYMRYVYLYNQPVECLLEVFTPGMVSTIVYINGTRVTVAGGEANTLQSLDVAAHMKLGRNMIYVECESEFILDDVPASRYRTEQEYRDCDPQLPAVVLGCDGNPYKYKHAQGKFDARLTCNGRQLVVRGDESRADPRSVWHCQYWSTGMEEYGNTYLPKPDNERRHLPGNQDYGVPANSERDNNPQDPDLSDDGLDVQYEYICGTNPRDRDSNNNGIPDGDEDFDADGLVNRDEQANGSNPWLADTDDDGLIDGQDAGAAGHPAESLSPVKNLSLHFGGTSDDYVELPKQARFALQKWTLEAWVRPDADEVDGGIILDRWVSTNAINYQLGLGDGVVAPVNVPYVRFVPNFGGSAVVLPALTAIPTGQWSHVAATYYNRNLKLYVGGTNVATSVSTVTPAVFAGGPVIQRVGAGLKGSIDELRIWKTNRSAGEILANRDDVLTGLETLLAAYYRFDDSTSYTNGVGFTVGTSANNGTNGLPAEAAWVDGQVEDNLLKFAADWETRWLHAGSFRGDVSFSTNSAVLGPPQLQVYIEPDEAVLAGAQWSYNGGASWNDSGYLETRLPPGTYPVSFRMIDGWIQPLATNVTLARGVVVVLTNRYVQTASILLTLNNSADVLDAARWTPDGGQTWYRSGERAEGLAPGSPGVDIIFTDIGGQVPGYLAPATIHVMPLLAEGEDRVVTTEYSKILGKLQITFSPSEIAAQARWLVSGNTNWQGSGQTVIGLTYGLHTIAYNQIDGWTSPNSEEISILSGDLRSLERTYVRIPEPTSIRVTITPDTLTNAQWRVGSGAWTNSGAVVLVDAGNYTVKFKEIDNWFAPPDIAVTVTNGYQTRLTANYGRLALVGRYGTNPGEFKYPRGLAVHKGFLYVTDSGNHRVQKLDLGTLYEVGTNWEIVVTTTNLGWATPYGGPTAGTAPGRFNQPFGISVTDIGDIWVADSGNYRIQHALTNGTAWTVYGRQGDAVGQFDVPYDVEVDSSGALYVADHHNSRIQKLVLPGTWSEFVPNLDPDPAVRFPRGLAIDSYDRVYVTDYDDALGVHRVRKFDTNGERIPPDVATADASDGGLSEPMGLSFGMNGHLFVTSAGSGKVSEGTPVSSSLTWTVKVPAGILNRPHDVAADEYGNVFVADTENHRIMMLVTEDADGDGVKNADEVIAGTNPFNDGSLFDIKAVRSLTPDGYRVVTWPSKAGRHYTVSILTNMVSQVWEDVPGHIQVPGTGTEMQYTNTSELTGVEFYRVRVGVTN